MAILSDFKNFCVIQRHPIGCIPTSIEWMLRYKGVQKVDLSNFLETFNLDLKTGKLGTNSFDSVPKAIAQIYPFIKLEKKIFQTGKEKLSFIEDLISKGIPCSISIALTPVGFGWHIVPVVEIDKDIVKVLWLHDPDITKQTVSFLRAHLEFIHDNWIGGQDILYLNYDSNISIFAYGSLIDNPGEGLKDHIIYSFDCVSPFSVEYARKSSARKGAPVLVISEDGGKVHGRILVTDFPITPENLKQVKELVKEREGAQAENIKTMEIGNIKEVIYCDIRHNIENPDGSMLANLAIESVKNCKKEGKQDKNGIKYLINNIKNGIITPLTLVYKNEILRITESSSLEEAEKKLLSEQ